MKEQSYTILAEEGIHARPAGFLIKKATEFQSVIQMTCKGKSASMKKLFALLKLGVKKGDTVSVSAEGADEQIALSAIMSLLEEKF